MHGNLTRVVIIGATSAIAEHCARLWVMKSTVELTLVGRDLAKTERVAADLRVRSPQSTILVEHLADFTDVGAIDDLVARLTADRPVHKVLIAHGSLPDQRVCEQDLSNMTQALQINGVSPVAFAEAFARTMEKSQLGTLAVIGSVAGERGRKSNYVYGAAKGLVTRYAEGLQHRFARSPVKVVLIKPGPTETPMTASMRQSGKGGSMARVEDVAAAIVQGVDRGTPVIYAPAKWALIMLIISNLPRFVFNKMDI